MMGILDSFFFWFWFFLFFWGGLLIICLSIKKIFEDTFKRDKKKEKEKNLRDYI